MKGFLARARAMRFHYLLGSLVLLLAVYPYVGAGPTGPAALKVLSSFVLITGVYAVSDRRRQVVIAGFLAIPAFGFGWLHVITGAPVIGTAEIVFTLLFYAFTALVGLSQVLGERRITTDTIYGAVSVYLLMGLTWANAYALVESVNPGSFSTESGDGAFTFPAFIYFSFVTLTTLGYGDITPITDQARSLAVLEMVSGTLYIAVLIARLVAAAGWMPKADRE